MGSLSRMRTGALVLLLAAFPSMAAPAFAEEIVITCTGCEGSETDIFLQEQNRLAEAFNEKYKGRYRIEYVPFSGVNDSTQAIPYYKRLASTGDLPDIFSLGFTYNDLGKGGGVVEWTPYLEADLEWKNSFYPDAFLGTTDTEGKIWAIPSFRNAIGTFWNKELFAQAGVTEFPTTWEEMGAALEKLKAAGITPIAMDGAWTTRLWWGNLIGTKPGGAEFLSSGIRDGNFAGTPAVIEATEQLKKLYTDGYVNNDALSGNFFAADAHFVTGRAAMLANGPWEIQVLPVAPM